MRQSRRSLVTFLAGLVVGIVTAGAFVSWHWKRHWADWHVGAVGDLANVAREIYSGRSKELADRIRESLPMRMELIEQQFPRAQAKEWTYWIVSDVYKASGDPVPASLAPILSALPPRPTCKKPSRKVPGGAA